MGFAILVAFVGCVIILPFLAQRKYKNPAILFAIVAAVYLVFGALGYFLGGRFGLTLANGTAFHDTYYDQTYADTYYAASTFHYRNNMAIVMLVTAALLWLQQKLKALRYTRTTLLMFWIMNLGLLASDLSQQIMLSSLMSPPNLVSKISLFNSLTLYSNWVALASSAMLPLLMVMFIVSIIIRFISITK